MEAPESDALLSFAAGNCCAQIAGTDKPTCRANIVVGMLPRMKTRAARQIAVRKTNHRTIPLNKPNRTEFFATKPDMRTSAALLGRSFILIPAVGYAQGLHLLVQNEKLIVLPHPIFTHYRQAPRAQPASIF